MLVIGFVSMVLSTAVVLQAETTRGEVVEIQPPVVVDGGANKPDIIKLPPVPPKVPEVPGDLEEKKIGGEGVNGEIPDEGGGRVVDGDKEQRKEPPLPQEVVDKAKVAEENDKVDVAKPEKPVEPVKVDNPANNVIDIPPNGDDAKQKPAEPVLPDPNNQQPAKVVDGKAGDIPKEDKQKDAGEHKEVGGANNKVEEGKAVIEDKAKEGDKRDSPREEGGEVNKNDHKKLEKHLEKLSNRLDQLEEENKELREKQEIIQRIQIEQGQDGAAAGDGAEQAKVVPPAPQDSVAQKEVERKDNINIPKDSAAKLKPTVSINMAGALDVDKQEKAILDALEKEEDRAERGINEPQEALNENEQAIEEHKMEVVEGHKAAAAAADGGDKPPAVGGDDGGDHKEPAVGLGGAAPALGGDTKVKEGKERVRENRDVELDSKLKVEMAAVHQVEQDELGENAGNINIAAPVDDGQRAEKKSIGAGGGAAAVGGDENVQPPQDDSVKYRKRDLKNANGSILSR